MLNADQELDPFLAHLKRELLGLDSLAAEETCGPLRVRWPVCCVLTASATHLYRWYCWICHKTRKIQLSTSGRIKKKTLKKKKTTSVWSWVYSLTSLFHMREVVES